MKRRWRFFLAGLVCVWTAAVFGQTCKITKQADAEKVLAPGDLFQEVMKLPTRFSTGVARIGRTFVLVDRHRDEAVVVTESGREVRAISFPAYEPSALSYDGTHLVGADRGSGRIYFLDPESGECVHTIEAPLVPVTGMACDNSGHIWIAASGAEEIQQIDPSDGTTLASIPAPSAKISALAFDPNGYLWAADSSRDVVFLVDIRTGYTIFSLNAPSPVVTGLWLDGRRLYLSDYQTDRLYVADVYSLHGRFVRDDARRGQATLYTDVQNLGPGTVTGGTIVVAVPENGPNQELEKVTWTQGARMETDQWGQRVAVYEIGKLMPGETRSIRLTGQGTFYRISCKIFPHLVGSLAEISEDVASRYLADADKYRVKSAFIRKKVREIVGTEDNPYVMARRLYDFLIGRINYQMVGGWDIAPTVIERGTGSCSEYTFSYVALCRAAGIPARYVGAMVLRGEDASVDTAYHRWAEIYLPRVGWIPVDVNAGDRKWQGDRCFSFGGIANRFLITTRGGGDSRWLRWGYNAEVQYRTMGKANVRIESFAEWDVIP